MRALVVHPAGAPAAPRPPCRERRAPPPRSSACAAPILLALAAAVASAAERPQRTDLQWDYEVVGTPDVAGPNPIGGPGFAMPTPIRLLRPVHVACDARDAAGVFEATLQADGSVGSIRSLHDPIEGTACQKRAVLPALRQWRFMPARYQGRVVTAFLRIRVSLP